MNIPTPQGMEFREWSAVVAEQNAQYGILAPENDDWAEWASSLINNIQISHLPNPIGFAKWTDWAEQFYGCVR